MEVKKELSHVLYGRLRRTSENGALESLSCSLWPLLSLEEYLRHYIDGQPRVVNRFISALIIKISLGSAGSVVSRRGLAGRWMLRLSEYFEYFELEN